MEAANPKSLPEYDAIVVGSGAAGGMSAYVLAAAGARVLMIEAGRHYDPIKETPMWNTPAEAPLRAAPTPDKPLGYYDATVGGGWEIPGEPYSNAPGTNFRWWRPRMLGGRTNHWGRIALRFGSFDFKPRSRDGLGVDWPIDYQDVAPYYDKTELLIGVFGDNEGLTDLQNTPPSSPGVLLPPPPPRAHEILVRAASRRLDIPCIASRLAILSRSQNADTIPELLHPDNPVATRALRESMQLRSTCLWATDCIRGCRVRANFQSPTVLLPPALSTGNLQVWTNAMVRSVSSNKNGRATGVHVIDKLTRRETHVRGRVVVLAAGACESARILLNSRTNQWPNGLANNSGLLGRYLMDSVGAGLAGQIPALENLPPHNDDGASGTHLYMPWWQYRQQLDGKLDFARGYHIEIQGGRRMPGADILPRLESFTDGAFGTRLKEECRRYYGSYVEFRGRGEMIPNENSYCELDPSRVDTWGIPVLRFHWEWSEHETRQAAHMQRSFAEIINTLGGRVLDKPEPDGKTAISKPGSISHEVGGVTMGANRKSSVLNPFCQAWDVKNLFVTDGGCFVSNGDKNPTLTIMALAWRACDYLLEEMRKGEI